MAEEKEDAAPEDEKATKAKKSNKSLFIVIGIITLALVIAAAAYFVLFSGKDHAQEAKQEQKKEVKTALVPLDSFVLNLAEQGRFLKVTMQFELGNALDQPLVAEKTPQLRDAIITLMSSKSVEAVSSPEGKIQLKDELLLRANQSVGKNIFKNLYFTEFVMQ